MAVTLTPSPCAHVTTVAVELRVCGNDHRGKEGGPRVGRAVPRASARLPTRNSEAPIPPLLDLPLYIAYGVTNVRDMQGCAMAGDPFIACAEDKRRWTQEAVQGRRWVPAPLPPPASWRTGPGCSSTFPVCRPSTVRQRRTRHGRSSGTSRHRAWKRSRCMTGFRVMRTSPWSRRRGHWVSTWPVTDRWRSGQGGGSRATPGGSAAGHRNTRRIAAVVFNGNLYDRQALDDLQAHVRTRARSWSVACRILWRLLRNPVSY
jgi:hypothetical protein